MRDVVGVFSKIKCGLQAVLAFPSIHVLALVLTLLVAAGLPGTAWGIQRVPADVSLGRLGKLPAPLPMPSEDPDEAAALLAKRVLAGGRKALPALVTALQAAGFTVQGPNGKVLVEPLDTGQGLAFGAWEVQALARVASLGAAIPLKRVGAKLSGALTELEDAPLADLIREDILTQYDSPVPELRFWARFTVELGLQATPQQDLLGTSSRVNLNAVQLALITRRLGGDLWAFADDALARKRVERSAAFAARRPPCAFEGVGGTVRDAAEVAATTAFEKVLIELEGRGMAAAGKIKKVYGWSNLVLAYAKVLMSYAAFKADFEMVPPKALLRTTDRTPHEHRLLKATLRLDIGRAEWINCFRDSLNGLGLGFDLPNHGAVGGAKVTWHITRGGPAGKGDSGIVVWGKGYDPERQITDKQGVSEMIISGAPQPRPVNEKTAVKVRKTATVMVESVLKRADIFQDFVDAIDASLSLPTLPASLLERTLPLQASYSFPVIDWAEEGAYRIRIIGSTTCCGVSSIPGMTTDQQASFEIEGSFSRTADSPSELHGSFVVRSSGTMKTVFRTSSGVFTCQGPWQGETTGTITGTEEDGIFHLRFQQSQNLLEQGTARNFTGDLPGCSAEAAANGELVAHSLTADAEMDLAVPGAGQLPWRDIIGHALASYHSGSVTYEVDVVKD